MGACPSSRVGGGLGQKWEPVPSARVGGGHVTDLHCSILTPGGVVKGSMT